MRKTRKGRYEDYHGSRQWEVAHPRYGRCHVLSPDPDSAMVAAAIVWGPDGKLSIFTVSVKS